MLGHKDSSFRSSSATPSPPSSSAPSPAPIRRRDPRYAAVRRKVCFDAPSRTADKGRSDGVEIGRDERTTGIAGEDIPKSALKKKQDYGITDIECEPWVQCDRCDAWQHQICSLFNERKNKAKQSEYICPTCLLDGIGNGEQLLSQTTVIGAKDLPTTRLSDHVEEWLAQHLNKERQERARSLGKSFDEVPGAEDLFVRVVSSVKKTVEVKQLFRKNFQEQDYSSEFPYKSKAILLFQKIEGADVCLFAMYVQEFGSECPQPNTRRVSISYIDSVKYFRPDIKAASGESLRTFVYHHVLLGYLSYCKMCGFTSCYIWVCPPLKRDDYILYCHPEIQKMPKLDKLRQWYHAMIHKAKEEKIVVGCSNLYDDFFLPTKECNAKITATRLPYFDNDYWPEEAEVILQKFENESTTNRQKSSTRRALKAAKRDTTQATPGDQNDVLLMHELGQLIRPVKENFIMIHLQHFCSQCCEPILSGKDRHPIDSEEHSFYMVEVGKVPSNTDDKDRTMASDIFETRMAFLNFCQANHYEFGTLRRAKHSSLMVLYLLHTSKCNVCSSTIEPAEGFHCQTCPAYNVCDSCHQKEGVAPHDHRLILRSTICRFLSQSRLMKQKLHLLNMAKKLNLMLQKIEESE
ncbi:hypothetical protein J5N97_027935 [Dioscorea zingiberensis]|uniref:histone acetyltransferase n=1 Tax=Dioscorea zingiberensis TaxID=325984 RepID=A0A9D5BY40_9LILI|nr:hypothetical protein J5N97_027935 [Dioscorea zingiberensis]